MIFRLMNSKDEYQQPENPILDNMPIRNTLNCTHVNNRETCNAFSFLHQKNISLYFGLNNEGVDIKNYTFDIKF